MNKLGGKMEKTTLTVDKVNGGYYTVKNDKGQRIFNKEYQTINFETKKRALFFINTMQAIIRDGGKIPYEFKY